MDIYFEKKSRVVRQKANANRIFQISMTVEDICRALL